MLLLKCPVELWPVPQLVPPEMFAFSGLVTWTSRASAWDHPRLVLISFSFRLERDLHKKALPQIRIDLDPEDTGFFWKKGSETDL